MKVVEKDVVDNFVLNVALAKALGGGDKASLHIFRGKEGYRVRVLAKGVWKTVNFRNDELMANVEKVYGVKVDREDGCFRAKVGGARIGQRADDRRLAVALAVMNGNVRPSASPF